MNVWDYVVPTSLVVPLGVNIDTLVYLSLFTVFHPVLSCLFYYYNLNWFSGKYCFAITLLWIARGINKYCRSFPNNDKNLVVLITGGSNGLGFECVRTLHSDRKISKIFVVDLHSRIEFNKMKKVEFIKFDLNNDVEELLKVIKNIDVMILNAGMRQVDTIESMSPNEVSTILNINLLSNIKLLKLFISNTPANKDKHIIAVGSVLGFVGPRKLGIYSCCKISLLSIMESLRVELPSSTRLSTILPGQLNSQMFADVSVNEILAPIIDIRLLSLKIRDIINNGENGCFAYPLYGRFLPLYQILPWWLQKWCRWFSGMDNV